jgi:alkylation response protein AidB-like acyl-CoA dehydrogenase
MDFDLQPRTAPGQRLIALAETHAVDFATRAEQHDRDGSFPFENFDAMKQSGVMAACVPETFGGLGVASVHDYVLGISRLGRGDASTAIAANMHMVRPWRITRLWKAAKAQGDMPQVERLERLLRQIGAGDLVMCAPFSEAGTDLLHPLAQATKVDGGWLINGRKIFGTMSPAAQILDISCRVEDAQRGVRWTAVAVPREAAGVSITNNWDALGMRASGSHDIVFTDCFVPDTAVTDVGPWGEWNDRFLVGHIVLALGLTGVFLGIAETARRLIIDYVKAQRRGVNGRVLAERYAIQHIIAEIEIDLAACRAMLERTTSLADTILQADPSTSIALGTLHDLMKDLQCTKWLVNRKAIDIVDRALTATGGTGYLSKHPLSRLYRDVRAGPFMQFFSPNEAFEYIGKVTLGLDPALNA